MNPAYPDPTEHPGTESLLRAIAENGKDNLPKHIFADWLEENGYDNAAKGMRWAAKYSKRPLLHDEPPYPGGEVSGWLFSPTTQHHADQAQGKHARLPDVMYNQKHHALLSFHDAVDEKDRPAQHWKDFLGATHYTSFDDDNEPLSQLHPDQNGADLVHPKK